MTTIRVAKPETNKTKPPMIKTNPGFNIFKNPNIRKTKPSDTKSVQTKSIVFIFNFFILYCKYL